MDSIEFVLTKTDFLTQLSKLWQQIGEEFKVESEMNKALKVSIECLKVIFEHIDSRKSKSS